MQCTSKYELLDASPDEPLLWDPVDSFSKSQLQSDFFHEQKSEIKTCVYAIYKYCNILTNGTFTKNVGIPGIPGEGKTWCGM